MEGLAGVLTREEVTSGGGFTAEVIPGSKDIAVSAARVMADTAPTTDRLTGVASVGDLALGYSRPGLTGRIIITIPTCMTRIITIRRLFRTGTTSRRE